MAQGDKISALMETDLGVPGGVAQIITPEFYQIPFQGNYTTYSDSDGAVYWSAGVNLVALSGLFKTPEETATSEIIAQIPDKYAPKRQTWITAVDVNTHLSYSLRLTPGGSLYSWSTALPQNATMMIPSQAFYVDP